MVRHSQPEVPSPQPRELRLFVALELPSVFKEALARVMDELRQAGAPPLRWVRPEGLHLTLKFLGSVEPARLAAIEAALQQAVPGPIEITLAPDRLGTFGGPARTRVIWAGLSGQVEELAALAQAIDTALAAIGFAKETRPFSPHLTLARVPEAASPAERRRISELVEAVKLPPLAPTRFTKVSLMQSFLQPGGAVYRRLRKFPADEPRPDHE